MSAAQSIADEYWNLFRETDHFTALWEGELEFLERWEDLSEQGLSSRRARLLDIADRARAAAADADTADQITLSTITWHARAAASV